jgi:hypothetical protein
MKNLGQSQKRTQKPTKKRSRKPANKPKTTTKSRSNEPQTAFFDGVKIKAFGTSKPPVTVQQSIPYLEMYKDGICRVRKNYFTKTIAFNDINYHLAQNEEKTHIFEIYCDFLNYFDSSVSVELSFVNQFSRQEDLKQAISIPETGDDFDSIRREYAEMLSSQLAKGNNGLVKKKYVTFGIESDSVKSAKPRLERIGTDILNNFRNLGVTAYALSGAERLELLYGQFHPDGGKPPDFNSIMKTFGSSGQNSKDFIAPTSLDFRDSKYFKFSECIGAVSFLQILAPELTDRMLADFLDMDAPVTVTIHIQSIDQTDAIKKIKKKLSDIDKMRIEEQKKAVRAGYDMDIIPTDLATYGTEAKTLLEDLQSRNERMFLATILVLNTAAKRSKLDNDIFTASGIAQKYNCALKRLDFQQEQGLMSSLVLGHNEIRINRGLTTSAVAVFVPFTTCELFQGGEAVYYGINALSNNMIMANRKVLKNPKELYCKGRFPNRIKTGGFRVFKAALREGVFV